jgi:hypothetical protein
VLCCVVLDWLVWWVVLSRTLVGIVISKL